MDTEVKQSPYYHIYNLGEQSYYEISYPWIKFPNLKKYFVNCNGSKGFQIIFANFYSLSDN